MQTYLQVSVNLQCSFKESLYASETLPHRHKAESEAKTVCLRQFRWESQASMPRQRQMKVISHQ